MKFALASLVVLLVVEFSGALPVAKQQTEEPKETGNEIDTAREGKPMIPHKFDPYDPHTRTAWEEERRKKLELLRQYYNKERDLESGMDPFRRHEEGDPVKLHAAEIARVKNSIRKLTDELAQMDHYRRELFKQYEMQKQFEEQQKEIAMDEEKRKQYHAQQEKLKEQEKKHEPLHHPGSKQQLEEVWEKQDHAEQEFDPEAFFNLHDLDSNGVWDQDEVSGLFQKELDKLNQADLPTKDPYERREEMERMREHIFRETDTDRNGLIDFHEFLKQTEDPDFQKDDGWEEVNGQPIYTQEEYDNYLREVERNRQETAQANMNAAGNGVPPHPNGGNYYQVQPQQQQQHHGDPNSAYHQGQMVHPAQYQNQIPPQQQPYQGHQQMVGHQQQPPQYQQVPVQQQHYQVPQNAPHVQIPHEQQYQHQVVQQTQQQAHINAPAHHNEQSQPQQQQQPQPQENPQSQYNSDQVNSKVQPAVQNMQYQAAVNQQPPPQQQQHSPNGVQPVDTNAVPAVPAVISKVNV